MTAEQLALIPHIDFDPPAPIKPVQEVNLVNACVLPLLPSVGPELDESPYRQALKFYAPNILLSTQDY